MADIINVLRVVPRDSQFLDRRLGSRGEIFFDQTNNTLRVFNGQIQSGISLAKTDLTNVSNAKFLSKAAAAGVGSAGVNSFSTITVAGQNNVVADSSSDTLTLVAGSNITITTDSTNDRITISASGGGGGGGNTSVSVGPTIPAIPTNGNLWLNTNNGVLYVYVSDGDSDQWIQPAAPTPILSAVAVSGNYNDLINTPDLSVYGRSFSFSVAADDSTQREITSGNLIKFIGAGGLTTSSDADGTITITGGGSTGNVTFNTTTIDTSDSSAITFTPAVVFNSDITVDNDIFVSNNLFSTVSITTPKITSLSSALTLEASSIVLDGSATFYRSTEVVNSISGATGTVTHNFQNGSLFLHSSIAANFTANFTNVPTTDGRSITVALILDQGATAYIPNAVQINGNAQTIKWSGGTPPSGTNNYTDIVNFTLIRSGGSWTVLGSLSTYN